MKEYIKKHLKSTSAHKWILQCILKALSKMEENSQIKDLLEVMKALNYLFQVIVKSRHNRAQQYEKIENKGESEVATFNEEEASFQKNVSEVMALLNKLYQKETPVSIVGVQGNFLKYIGSFFDNIAQIFDAKKLGTTINEFLDCISEKKKNLMQGKLNAMENIARGEPFKKDMSRTIVIPKYIEQLTNHFMRIDAELQTPAKDDPQQAQAIDNERTACVGVVMSMLETIHDVSSQRKGLDENLKDSVYNIFSLLPQLCGALEYLVQQVDAIQRKADLVEKQRLLELQQKQELAKQEQAKQAALSPTPEPTAPVATPTNATESSTSSGGTGKFLVNISNKPEVIVLRKKQAEIITTLLGIVELYDVTTLEYHLKRDEDTSVGLNLVRFQLSLPTYLYRKH